MRCGEGSVAIGNVLVSSAGRRVGLVEMLRGELAEGTAASRIIATDASPLSAASHIADEYVRVPRIDDAEFGATLRAVCEDFRIGLLIPTIDPELPYFAHARDEFAEIGTLVLASGPATVKVSSDKRRTHRWLTERGVPTVDQWNLAEAKEDRDGLPYPVIVKPVAGSASHGVERVDEPTGLFARDDADLIVQSLAPGYEYTVDVWVDKDGEPRCAVPRRRLEVRAGEVSKGLTEARSDVIDTAIEVARMLPDAFGPVTVQIFAEGPGEVNVIEINPRFGGGFPLSHESGARYLRWALQEAEGAAYDPGAFEWRDGVLMLRYDEAVFLESVEIGL
jgi:carbamoyl-phosphate synthase large subunit